MSEIRRARTFLVGIPAAVLMTCGPNRPLTAQAPAVSVLTGSAVLDDWGNRFTSLGVSVRENSLRTQVRTTIAQLAMFDAVNAVLALPALRIETRLGSRRLTRSRSDPRRLHRRPQRVPDQNCRDRECLQHVDRPYSRKL